MKVYNKPKNGYPWCACFAMWCMVQAFGLDNALKITNQVIGGDGASCTYLVNRYKSMGSFYADRPQPGDQIFFWKNRSKGTFAHTGLVTKVDSNRVYTIEGNTSSAQGVVDNGGCVRQKSYLLNYNKIGGYGRPKYELIQEEEEVTQEQFNKMFDIRIQELRARPATFEQEAIQWANENEILKGDKDGFAPKGYITRGETVVVLKRFFDKFIAKLVK